MHTMKRHWTRSGTQAPSLSDRSSVERVQNICLLAVVVTELLFFLLEDRANGIAYLFVERFLVVPSMIFLGASLTRNMSREAKRILMLSAAMLLWFFVAQSAQKFQQMDGKKIGVFFCTYGMFLPFAALTGDENHQKGLKMFASVFIAEGILLVGYAALLLARRVPGYLLDYVCWDGTRFHAMGHPNICATLLMISITFCMGFFFRVQKRWAKALLLVWSGIQFAVIAITNGRTTAVFCCALLGGMAFCALRRPGWKRTAAALLAAVVVMAALFVASQKIVGVNKAYLEEAVKQAEESGQEFKVSTGNTQKSWEHDIRSLNGRTTIWGSAAKGLKNNPKIAVAGTDYVGLIVSQYNPFEVFHTHNSWLEALYQRGLPGLLLVLVITVMAVWDAAVLLWRNTDMWKSCIALLVLCLLGCAILEPYLFTADVDYHYFDMLFMLCVGYLHMWRKQTT